MRLKVKNHSSTIAILNLIWLFILETSIPEHTDASMDNTDEITGLPSALDQSTQAEDVLDLTKEDVTEEQGTTLPSQSQNETEVWLLISFEWYLYILQNTINDESAFMLKSNTWNILLILWTCFLLKYKSKVLEFKLFR